MKQNAFYSVTVAIFLAVAYWVGNKTGANTEAIVKSSTELSQVASELTKNIKDHERFEHKLDGMVARRDYDIEVAKLNAEIINARARLTALELDLVKVKAKVGM